MKDYFLYLIFIFLSLNLLAQKSIDKKNTTWQQAIYKLATQELKNTGTPSLQIAIGYKDSLIFEKAFGFANLEHKIPAKIETKYRIASISKWFTATAAIILANEGKINLDKPIQEYCPYFPNKKLPITSRQLLTHTAGIRSYIDLEEELSKARKREDSLKIKNRYKTELLGTYTRYDNLKDALDNFKEDDLLFEPGTNWSYSSQGYRLLGSVIEGASNQKYKELINELIFKPVEMKNTIEDDAWEIIDNRTSGYRLQRGKPLRRADMRDVSENLPAGGHLSTTSDLVRFAQAFVNKKFFSQNYVELMSTAYFKKEEPKGKPSWRDAIPSMEKYGYGVMLFPDEEIKRIGHTGRQAGASSIVIVIPEKEITIAVLTNAKGWNGYMSFTKAIEDIITNNL